MIEDLKFSLENFWINETSLASSAKIRQLNHFQ